jgi:hypothetical protein
LRYPCDEVRFSKELQVRFDALPQTDKMRTWLTDMKAILKENMLAGERVAKDKIPKVYLVKYGVHNLYHYCHPEYYRSSYTILSNEKKGIPLVIDFISHGEYSKLFGYR